MWIILQTNLAKWQSKKRCAIVSWLVQKQHCIFPCQLHLAKLSLVKITPQWSSQMKTLTLRGILSFHSGLFIGKIVSSKSAVYIECTENCPLLCRDQTQISGRSTRCTKATLATRSCQSLRLFPTKFLPKDTLSGFVFNTFCTVSCFRCTRLNRFGYCSLMAAFPSHLASQNLICSPFWSPLAFSPLV